MGNPGHLVGAVPSVWVVPLPWYSHMLGHLNLAKQLAKRGLSVNLFIPDEDLGRLVASGVICAENWEREGLSIRIQSLPVEAIVVGCGNTDAETHDVLRRSVLNLEAAFAIELKKSIEFDVVPTCLISDLWLPGTRVRENGLVDFWGMKNLMEMLLKDVATQYGIPAWTLCTFSALYVSTSYYLLHLNKAGVLKLPKARSDPQFMNSLLSLPGLNLCSFEEIPQACLTDNVLHELTLRNVKALERSEIILLSGFQELEEKSIQALKVFLKSVAAKNRREAPHIWTIGPTFSICPDTNRGPEPESHKVIGFLDSQPKSSVVFMALGSNVNLTRQQIIEFAYGLKDSQQPFICFLLPPAESREGESDDIFEVIPADLVERTNGKGLFLQSWAPQMKILGHPSTGVFISHCGFNSVFESVCMGVPILALPDAGEQHLNCRWLVDELKVGLELSRRTDGLVTREEVGRRVRELSHGQQARIIRQRSLELKNLAQGSVGVDGSSTRYMTALVDLIKGGSTRNISPMGVLECDIQHYH